MFANRYTAFIDACSLVGALQRNLLLTLAEAEFYRVRWSAEVMNETRAAIETICVKQGLQDAADRARRSCEAMSLAFEDAEIDDYDAFRSVAAAIPDPKDVQVLAAALKIEASVIVTENLRDFPSSVLGALNIEARSADMFIADTIALDEGRAVAAIRRMRERLRRPEMTAGDLLLRMEAAGLTATADVLRPHIESL